MSIVEGKDAGRIVREALAWVDAEGGLYYDGGGEVQAAFIKYAEKLESIPVVNVPEGESVEAGDTVGQSEDRRREKIQRSLNYGRGLEGALNILAQPPGRALKWGETLEAVMEAERSTPNKVDQSSEAYRDFRLDGRTE